MQFQFSTDNTNWDDTNDFNLDTSVSSTRRFQFPVTAQYFRVVYTNGAVAQTAFRMQTILHSTDVLTSIHRIDTGLDNDRPVTVTKSVIAGETTAGGGSFVNVKVTPSGALAIDTNGTTVQTNFKDELKDAFGRLRVSNLHELFNLTQLHDDQPLLVDTVTNATGTSVHSTTNASTLMSTAASGDYVIRQTKERFHYFAGQSALRMFTMSGFDTETNVEKQAGYYSSSTSSPYNTNYDGLFWKSDATGVSINVYRSGTQVEQTYESSFNVDALDGTGPSGITIDWNDNQIYGIDFQYLGVGRVRWFVDIDGDIILVHESKFVNSGDTLPYMSSPNQPMRWEIRQTGAGSGSMRQICATALSEGAMEDLGLTRGVDLGTTHVDANSVGTEYAIVGIRLKTTHLDSVVTIKNFSMLSITTDSFLWKLKFNPTVAGTFTYSDVSDSSCQFATGATANTVTGGTTLESGYQYQQSTFDGFPDEAIRLGVDIDGTRDTLVLTATPLSSNADILGSINWKELI
jgi:hypothetical protein